MRKFLNVALWVFFACSGSVVARAATPATPPAAITALVQAVLDAANANDSSKFAGMYTDDAVAVDEASPFMWTGENAGVNWWKSVQKTIAAQHGKNLHVTGLPITEYLMDAEGDDAYAIQPLKIAVTDSAGKVHIEQGAQTYTFHKSKGAWKISSVTWTTKW